LAAARYRKKLKTNHDTDRLEVERLEERNAYLRTNVEMLMEQISNYKQIILENIRKCDVENK
uniref:BZIP domain-containing protein n=1 Tax=Gongylonema pulchrum TaxID=637853 RepID=A0A183E6M8_9BILA